METRLLPLAGAGDWGYKGRFREQCTNSLDRTRTVSPWSGKGWISERPSVTPWRTSKCRARGLGRSAKRDRLSLRTGNLAARAQRWSESAGDAKRPGTEPSGRVRALEWWGCWRGRQAREPALGAPRSRKKQVSAVYVGTVTRKRCVSIVYVDVCEKRRTSPGYFTTQVSILGVQVTQELILLCYPAVPFRRKIAHFPGQPPSFLEVALTN